MSDVTRRAVRAVHQGRREDLGDLVTRRAEVAMDRLDPFLFLAHHGPQVYPPGNAGLPFGPHPHRGFETVTFVVDGVLTHRDSAGYTSSIHAGGIQWMTAGSGIVHAETSPAEYRERGGPLEILQMWINLPARLKRTPPRYVGLERDRIPEAAIGDGAQASVIAGELGGVRGPVDTLTGHVLATVRLAPRARTTLPAPRGRTVFLYVVRGDVRVGGRDAHAFDLVELDDDGDAVDVEAPGAALLIFGHAQPLHEPVVAYGPFVMNSEDEIREAIRDYQDGRFAGSAEVIAD